MKNFLSDIKTTVIGTINEDNTPFSSYAPYVYENNRFYIYISNIATHAQNIQRNPKASLFFIEDESKSENLFARKRVSLQCDSCLISRESDQFNIILDHFESKFDTNMVQMLKKMTDFNLFELQVTSGEATFGFGEAYSIGGDDMNTFVPRKSKSGGHGHGHGHSK